MAKKKVLAILKRILRWLAIWTIRKYNPTIIGVTGSVGKTSAKEAIAVVVSHIRRTRTSSGNFNNEIGLPLTILGGWSNVGGFWFWIKVLSAAIKNLIIRTVYPELLVLEYGADHPGDLRYLLEIARPKIGVITAIGNVPVHVEFYNGPEAVAREKARLIEQLPASGYAVLNYDDEMVMGLTGRTRAKPLNFGFNPGAEVRVSGFEHHIEDGKPIGVSFKIEYGGSFVPVRIPGVFGRPVAYAAAAAACVGIAFGLNLVKIAEALAYLQIPEHRMRLLPGLKESVIADDTYNASPLSMRAAIETVKTFPARRKIAVLGDMLELGSYSMHAHQEVGKLIPKVFDLLITVGPRAKFIAEAARQAGLPKKNIQIFDITEEARSAARSLIKKGDLVLLKGSRGVRLERLVSDLTWPPTRAR